MNYENGIPVVIVEDQRNVVKTGVFASISGTSATTVITSGEYVPISGTFTNLPIEKFSEVSNGIKYIGTLSQYFKIDYFAELSDEGGTTAHIAIAKNENILSNSVMGTFLKNAGENYNIAGTVVVQLQTNDIISLMITADGNNKILKMHHFTTSIAPFFCQGAV
jgi:hypothetical protein